MKNKNVYVVDWGKHYSKITEWNSKTSKRENIFPIKTELPDYCGIEHHWEYKYDRKSKFDEDYNPDAMFMYPRVFIQLEYYAKCTKTGEEDSWRGRKWYLSEHMTDDEIIKTCYCAFEAAVKHEIMEGFKVDGKILFNPHINFEELLLITNKEVKRLDNENQ